MNKLPPSMPLQVLRSVNALENLLQLQRFKRLNHRIGPGVFNPMKGCKRTKYQTTIDQQNYDRIQRRAKRQAGDEHGQKMRVKLLRRIAGVPIRATA